MVELAIALVLLAAIVVPYFYYGVFITDLAAWKTTLYHEARDESMGGKGKHLTLFRYTLLTNSNFERKNKKNQVLLEGKTEILDIQRWYLFQKHQFEASHAKYKEDPDSYNKSWLGKIVDFFTDLIKRGWEALKNLVSYWSERFFS